MLTKKFILAGNATFTISNGNGESYSFNVKRKLRHGIYIYCLYTVSFQKEYMGLVSLHTGKINLTARSCCTENDKIYKIASWTLAMLWNKVSFPNGYSINHNGYCGRCGRRLTTRKSITRGLGPDCWDYICGGGRGRG